MNEARVRAPEFPAGLQWFNVSRPLTLAELRGRVVLLDFWTYCCINCMHVLPDLDYLERKYGERLAVIGVHSPKFPQEKVAEQLQKAIQRHHIRHPVAHDPAFRLWKAYAIKAWPSLVVIDPQGYAVGVARGEGKRELLDRVIGEQLAAVDREPEHALPISRTPARSRPLLFPGKLLATAERLYVSDTGHNRVLELDHGGNLRRAFGGTEPGLVDGSAEIACFNEPQGLLRLDDSLLVADRGNHALRRIDLLSGEVDTLIGDGRQGRGAETEFADARKARLNSPWDLARAGNRLYIAQAGRHEIWVYDRVSRGLRRYAGCGREDLVDGTVAEAAFAQPSGLAMGEGHLYVIDAESSAIRDIHLLPNRVSTLVGQGLFEFGDADGVGRAARLQHPLGIALDRRRGCLWIADSFNNRIRHYRLADGEVTTLALDHPLDEPGGLSVAGDSLYIANTNAHEVVRVDLADGSAETLEIHD